MNFGRSILTNHFPELWPFFLGGLFVAVVLLFPDGWSDWGNGYVKVGADSEDRSFVPEAAAKG